MAAELAPGKWELESSDKFDDYLKALGISLPTRMIITKLKPSQEISVAEDGTWTIKTLSTFKNTEISFKLGEQFQEKTGDGREVQTTFTVDGNKLIQEQKGTVDTTIVREFSEDSFVMTMEAKGVECTRKYKKAS